MNCRLTPGTSDTRPLEPEPVNTGSIDFPPFDNTPPEDLTPEELALTFPDDPTPTPLPETQIDTPAEESPVSAPPISAPPTDQVPMTTVEAPAVPNTPPLTPPTIDNGPLVNPQPATDLGATSMPGGSNDSGSQGTPGLVHTENTGSSTATPVHEPPPSDYVLLSESDKLGRNLIKEGRLPPVDDNGIRIPGWQAHHIIPFGDRRASDLRDKLKDWKIDLNVAGNGVWLPQNGSTSNPSGSTTHNQTFRGSYFEYLDERFANVTTPEGALDLLESIRDGLESGDLQFRRANGEY